MSVDREDVLHLECSLGEGLAVGGSGMQIGRRLFAHVLREAEKSSPRE